MNRRSLLGAMLAACAAPAFVRAESLMILPKPRIWTPEPILITQFAGGRLEIFDGTGGLLASDAIDLRDGRFRCNTTARASGTAKIITFITPAGEKFTLDAGGFGSGAGFEMDCQNLMAGDVLMTSGAISLR